MLMKHLLFLIILNWITFLYLPWDNFLIYLNRLIGKKGRIASSHLVHQHTKCPPINSFVVTLIESRSITKFALAVNDMLLIKRIIRTLLRMISGARYSGVPHSVHVRPLTLLANPKSVTCKSKEFIEPFRVRNESRWKPLDIHDCQ